MKASKGDSKSEDTAAEEAPAEEGEAEASGLSEEDEEKAKDSIKERMQVGRSFLRERACS